MDILFIPCQVAFAPRISLPGIFAHQCVLSANLGEARVTDTLRKRRFHSKSAKGWVLLWARSYLLNLEFWGDAHELRQGDTGSWRAMTVFELPAIKPLALNTPRVSYKWGIDISVFGKVQKHILANSNGILQCSLKCFSRENPMIDLGGSVDQTVHLGAQWGRLANFNFSSLKKWSEHQ